MNQAVPQDRSRRHTLPVIALLIAPLLGNALIVSGLLHNNPALFAMFLTKSLGHRPILAAPGWFDPTIGLITQPLGMLSAKDWLSGTVPWWNPYSGAGLPLAAEMQTMSFFLPFVLLLKSWRGWLLLKLTLQALCGLFTYALLIELRLTRLAALLGAMSYALCATFFLVPHVMGPLPFAPLLLLGIERSFRAATQRIPSGWGFIPLALAYLIYGGYPEVAYIDATLAATWTLWRFALAGPARRRFAGKIAIGVALGLALTLPLVVPFLRYVRLSYLGQHGYLYKWIWLLPPAAPMQLLPFLYGPIGAPLPAHLPARLAFLITGDWAQLGGWFGPVAALLALAAIVRPAPRRGLAWLLFGFIAFWQLRLWGFPPAVWLVDLIPMMGQVDSLRFSAPAMELACFIMLAIAIDAWQREGALDRAAIRRLGLAAAALILLSLLPATLALYFWYHPGTANPGFALGITAAELALAAAALTLLIQPPDRKRALALTLVVACDLLGTSLITQLGAARSGTIDYRGVTYLQRHLGTARLYSLQPFGPNYPAAFGLAAIDENELPVPAAWNAYIHRHLDPYADVVMFTGSQARAIGCVLLPRAAASLRAGLFVPPQRSVIPPDQSAELRRHLAGYEAIGIKYVLSPPSQNPFLRTATLPVDRTVSGHASPFPLALAGGQTLAGTVPPGVLTLRRITQASVLIGTYNGAARGTLSLHLCANGACATGHAALATASDNHPLTITLDRPLPLRPGATIHYRLTHDRGAPVAIWLYTLDTDAPRTLAITDSALPNPARPRAPVMRFGAIAADAPQAPIFADSVMRIYRLAQPRPMFTASPACTLAPHGISRVTADCKTPARLLRLEAADPGWHALIDGRSAPITTVDALFQGVALPAGPSTIRFFYRPPFTRIDCAAALAALATWLALLASPALPPLRRRQQARPRPAPSK